MKLITNGNGTHNVRVTNTLIDVMRTIIPQYLIGMTFEKCQSAGEQCYTVYCKTMESEAAIFVGTLDDVTKDDLDSWDTYCRPSFAQLTLHPEFLKNFGINPGPTRISDVNTLFNFILRNQPNISVLNSIAIIPEIGYGSSVSRNRIEFDFTSISGLTVTSALLGWVDVNLPKSFLAGADCFINQFYGVSTGKGVIAADPKISAIDDTVCPECGVEFDLEEHLERQYEFSQATFGPGLRTNMVLNHMRKEIKEIEAAPTDLEEWIDMILLSFDGAMRTGAEPKAITDMLSAKLAKNEKRDWPDWRVSDTEAPIEHIRTNERKLESPGCPLLMKDDRTWNVKHNHDEPVVSFTVDELRAVNISEEAIVEIMNRPGVRTVIAGEDLDAGDVVVIKEQPFGGSYGAEDVPGKIPHYTVEQVAARASAFAKRFKSGMETPVQTEPLTFGSIGIDTSKELDIPEFKKRWEAINEGYTIEPIRMEGNVRIEGSPNFTGRLVMAAETRWGYLLRANSITREGSPVTEEFKFRTIGELPGILTKTAQNSEYELFELHEQRIEMPDY